MLTWIIVLVAVALNAVGLRMGMRHRNYRWLVTIAAIIGYLAVLIIGINIVQLAGHGAALRGPHSALAMYTGLGLLAGWTVALVVHHDLTWTRARIAGIAGIVAMGVLLGAMKAEIMNIHKLAIPGLLLVLAGVLTYRYIRGRKAEPDNQE